MGALRERIAADLREAMKARDRERSDTLRSVLAAFTYKRTEAGAELSDADELDAVRKQVKQRNDSFSEFTKAGRTELAEKEARERAILMTYMPVQKSIDEVRQIVKAIVSELPAGARNPGAVMKVAMPQLKGQADGAIVRQAVSDELGESGSS